MQVEPLMVKVDLQLLSPHFSPRVSPVEWAGVAEVGLPYSGAL